MDTFVCHDCGDIFSSKIDFNAHISSCVLSASENNENTGTINPPPRGWKRCPFCRYIVCDIKSTELLKIQMRLLKHVSRKHFEDIGPSIPWQQKYQDTGYKVKCKFCFGEYTRYTIKLHVKRKHNEDLKPIPCKICGKSFHPTLLNGHMTSMHGERDLKCDECGVICSNKVNLKVHKQRIHEDRRNFQCQECGKRFVDPSKLRQHTMSVHQKLKPFKCDFCDFVCGKISNLNLHRKKIHKATDNLRIKNFDALSLKDIHEKALNK